MKTMNRPASAPLFTRRRIATAFFAAFAFSTILRAQPTADGVIIVPGDEIQISVYREADLDVKTKVGPDGLATLHLIGPIKVAGLTKKQAESVIKDAYAKDVLVNPSVSLSVYPQPRENGTFVVAGRVEKQGVFEFPKLGDYISILEAIGMAGGFNRYSSRGNVKVRRQLGAETKIYEIDTKAISRNQKAKDFMILPGDSIYVEEIIWFD